MSTITSTLVAIIEGLLLKLYFYFYISNQKVYCSFILCHENNIKTDLSFHYKSQLKFKYSLVVASNLSKWFELLILKATMCSFKIRSEPPTEVTLLRWFCCYSKTLCIYSGSWTTNFVVTPYFRHARYCK